MRNLHIRRARQEDCRDLWLWRNDPESRNNSRSTDPVPWAQHRRWLAASLDNDRRIIYIALANRDKLGSVRFDLVAAVEHRWRVSIAVAPWARNKGIEQQMLMLACDTMESLNGALALEAEIRLHNTASEIIFRRCGFAREVESPLPGFRILRRQRAC